MAVIGGLGHARHLQHQRALDQGEHFLGPHPRRGRAFGQAGGYQVELPHQQAPDGRDVIAVLPRPAADSMSSQTRR